MFNIVLFEPEIPPNTGNIIRLCANSGAKLHLIRPLGFELSAKKLRRSGLDYHDIANINIYNTFEELLLDTTSKRFFAVTTKASSHYHEFDYMNGDFFIFGPETRGLPDWIRSHNKIDSQIRLPMASNSRSLNLSNSVAILLYEAWRQIGFKGGK
ncbi:MAG: tRNA (uridine(34)/cytosine(34)/5-carboxymethylaminomethyluridine(34)-2'-O)-methyltransferase TrmL [Methylophilaceae bacterium]|nr:tRNA (uridine(34)/cytosine(34)/5-carboxymethylaminomethyluridine(34)-2'-O)-methyltransferase TrmL [Methylophilaceae bacterium]MBL6726467.1 tRNA (uridine(34)/cytosine(34)/5-carboxymethylaminomethyluridine(34)-2'-O)-methyltransferase TrmL [Methylophilaceae bacterium]MBL6791149.1 tRNA (uridine(34)/cytosine(34)/5-carboxymethylaminomethyluridine(34)-2'-O)-methyltransferase TrmL [Methylophilaceae bacterium]